MRRASIHIAFGTLAFCLAGIAIYDGATLSYERSVAHAVVTLSTVGGAKPEARGIVDDAAEVRLARAMFLSKTGDYAGAQRLYDGLITADTNKAIQIAALFDLGNMYLREATRSDPPGSIQSLPMLEQAKERYRSVLRLAPDDWDARYNLERALRLAPEMHVDSNESDIRKQAHVKVRGAQSEDLP
ncbi:MAG: MxaL protein [Paraburkholderia sp.]|uniref:MxaL protein n=1 Tax=Paraburkholderia sp. TaxID=1926495 RepID=UPI0012258EE6|nr:MxaL protein [Paraburkholderia sp.]TAL96964.1 MAG: MxaL protein [Paraburkholderia sp.]